LLLVSPRANPLEIVGRTGVQIFISYRRGESSDIAGRISDRLRSEFGSESVFFDVDDIPVGEAFPDRLRAAIVGSDVLLAIIGSDWVSRGDLSEKDFVRIELTTALGENVRIIPVLVGGAKMPEASALPEPIHAVPRLQAEQVRSLGDFDRDVERLIEGIEKRGNFDPDLEEYQRMVLEGVRGAQTFEDVELDLSAGVEADRITLLLALQRMLSPGAPMLEVQSVLAHKLLEGIDTPVSGLDDAIRTVSDQIPADRNWLRRRLRTQTDSLRRINGAVLRLIGRNPDLSDLVPSLPALYEHLSIWVAKYEYLRTDDSMCLVFAGVAQRRPFPPELDSEIAHALGELARRYGIET